MHETSDGFGDEVLLDSDRALVNAVKFLRALGVTHPLADDNPDAPQQFDPYADRSPGHAMDSHVRVYRKALEELQRQGVRHIPELTQEVENALALMTTSEYRAVSKHLDENPNLPWSSDALDDNEKELLATIVDKHVPKAVQFSNADVVVSGRSESYLRRQAAKAGVQFDGPIKLAAPLARKLANKLSPGRTTAVQFSLGESKAGKLANRLEAAAFLHRTGTKRR